MGKGAMGKGGEGVDPKIFIAVILVGGLVEMWAASATCDKLKNGFDDCKDEYALAVAIGAISTFVCLVVSIIYCVKADLMSGVGQTVVAVILFLTWGIGTGVCTFDIPFAAAAGENAANGYYSTWVCFCAAVMFIMTVKQVKELAGKGTQGESGAVVVTFFSSVAEMWAAAYLCDNYNSGYSTWKCSSKGCSVSTCTDLEGWGVAVGCVSAVICLVFIILGLVGMKDKIPDIAKKIIAVLLFIWWAVGVATLTFSYKEKGYTYDGKGAYGLFLGAGNGYFGTWISFFSSFVFAYVTLLGKAPAGAPAAAPGGTTV
jgi:hypothetical protein